MAIPGSPGRTLTSVRACQIQCCHISGAKVWGLFLPPGPQSGLAIEDRNPRTRTQCPSLTVDSRGSLFCNNPLSRENYNTWSLITQSGCTGPAKWGEVTFWRSHQHGNDRGLNPSPRTESRGSYLYTMCPYIWVCKKKWFKTLKNEVKKITL